MVRGLVMRLAVGCSLAVVVVCGLVLWIQRGPGRRSPQASLLIETIKRGDESGARSQIDSGADVNARDPFGRTPLMWAAQKLPSLLDPLISRGARVREADSDGRTPLAWAVTAGRAESVRTLLGHGADVNSKDLDGFTPIILAATNDDVSILDQ